MRFWVGNTDERTLPVLDAAHIRPYAELGPHRLENGILLRTDLHAQCHATAAGRHDV